MSVDCESDDFKAKTEAFLKWMKQLPGARISPKIQVADLRDHNSGRGIIAVADIKADEELFSVSQSDVLTAQTSTLQQVKPHLLERLDAWNALILCMIHELAQGESSKWWPYLQILPHTFDTLIYWSPSELAELEGSAVLDKIGKDEADASFANILLPIVDQNLDLFGHFSKDFSGDNAKETLLEIAHRMATLIMAYGFDLEAEETSSDEEEDMDGSSQSAYELNKGMVPFADLFNADGHVNNAHLIQHEESLTMIALKDITAGQQIFNDFGQLPRSDLLRRYGYVTDNYREWDVVEVDVETLVQAAGKLNELKVQDKEVRLELAASWGVLQDGYDLTRPLENDDFAFDEDMVLTITALLLNPDEFARATEESSKSPQPHGSRTLDLVLKDIISTRQKAYKTTIADDREILQDDSVQGRHRMAVEVRLGEKEILALAGDEIDKKLSLHDRGTDHEGIADPTKRRRYG